jgi:hypothetical protein
MIHPAVHDADNISFGLEAMRTMITEGYSTSTVQSAAPTYMQHILIQHDGARQLTQWLRKQGHLALSEQHQFPIIPHLPFAPTEEYWTDPNIDENRPSANPPEFPLQSQVTGSMWRHSGAIASVSPTNKAHQGVRTLVSRCTTAPTPKWRLFQYTHSSPL